MATKGTDARGRARGNGPIIRLALGSALVLVMLQLLGAHLLPTRLWGLNALHFIPRPLEVILVAAALLLLLPPLARRVARWAREAEKLLFGGGARLRWLRILALGGVFFLLFAFLRSGNHFLGDGYFRLGQLSSTSFSLRSAEFLDLLIHREVWRGLRSLGAGDPALAYWLPSCLAGALWVILMPALSRRLIPEPSFRWTVPAFLLSLGSVQLFFGYVECYTFRELIILIYFILALRALAGGSPLPAAGALVVATAIHLTSLSLVPSLIPLLLVERWRARGDGSGARIDPRAAYRKHALVALVTAGVLSAAGAATLVYLSKEYGGLEALLPLRAGPERAYGLFSIHHLGDMANFLLLAAPGPILLLVMAGGMRVFTRTSGEPWGPAMSSPGSRERLAFWAFAVAGPLGLVFLLDPQLGSRDWDLMALPATPLALAALALLFGSPAMRVEAARSRLGTAAIMILGASLLHTVPWVLTNHDSRASARLVRLMVEDDPHHYTGRNPRFINLGAEFTNQGRHEGAVHFLKRAISLQPENFMAHYNLGTALMELDRLDEAVPALERAVALDPRNFQGRIQLGAIYRRLRRYTESIEELEAALEISPEHVFTRWNLGLSYLGCGRIREAVTEMERAAAELRRAQSLAPGTQVARRAGEVLQAIERGEEGP